MNLAQFLIEHLTEIQEQWYRRLNFTFTEVIDLFEVPEISWKEFMLYHLHYLRYAVILENPDHFKYFVEWVFTMLEYRDVPLDAVKEVHLLGYDVIEELLPNELKSQILPYRDLIDNYHLDNLVPKQSHILDSNRFGPQTEQYLKYLIQGDKKQAMLLIKELMNEDTPIIDLIQFVLQPSQYEIGRLWHKNDVSVAEEHIGTAINQSIFSTLFYDKIFSVEQQSNLKVITFSAGTELHEFGARVISDIFTLNGWNSIFVGGNTPNSKALNLIEKEKPDVIAISATMISTVYDIELLIADIRRIDSKVKIIVGGTPFNQNSLLWKAIGADASATDGLDAIGIVNSLVSG